MPIAGAQQLFWADQIGTSVDENAWAAAPDGSGGLYWGGETWGALGAPYMGMRDAWLRRVDSTGSELWTIQFGSATEESIQAAAPSAGGVFVGGFTNSSYFGQAKGQVDGWISRIDQSGNRSWSQVLGTSGFDWVWAMATDGMDGLYVVGDTNGDISGTAFGGYDAWVARLDSNGDTLWIRQIGTSMDEYSVSCAPDDQGGVYLSGTTPGALAAPSAGDFDAWVARVDPLGSVLWTRQFGTTKQDISYATASDGAGGVFVAGTTSGSLGGANAGQEDAWISRFAPDGTQLWITQIGTALPDHVEVATAGSEGTCLVAGPTAGSLGGPNVGGADMWAGRIDGSGNLLWTTQLGSNSYEYTQFAISPGDGTLAVGGSTTGAMAGQQHGITDAWIAVYGTDCNSGTTYCVASATSLAGCSAALSATGSPSVSAPNAYLISSGSIPGANLGICFFSAAGTASTPFGTLGGMICMQSPIYRSKPKPSGGSQGVCDGQYTYRLTDLIETSPIATSGATIHAQVWARDPQNPDGFLLSDAMTFTVCP